MDITSIIIIVCGVFSIVCAIFDFDWFMQHSKARFFVKIFSRKGARVFYIFLGIVLCILGIVLW